MEKIGLFDLIDKFNSVANGKNSFDKTQSKPTPTKEENAQSSFYDPQIVPPKQYLMNAKLLNFCKKHEEFSSNIKK